MKQRANVVARRCAKLESKVHLHVDGVLQQMFISTSRWVLDSSYVVMSAYNLH